MGAAPLAASVNCTGIAVIAVWSFAFNTAGDRIAGLNTVAWIAVITILWGIDTYCSVKRIIGTGVSIIAIPGSVIAYSVVAVIISAGIFIRAIDGQIHTHLAIESVLCTRIMVITFMMMKRI